MTNIKKSVNVPYTTTQMYDLVTRLEQYPEFISWCDGASVQSRTQTKLVATLHGSKLGINFSASIIYLLHPSDLIEIRFMYTGPFRQIQGFWRFETIAGKEGSQFSFELQYEFSNAMLGWTLSPIIRSEAGKLLNDFTERAKKIYS